MNGKFYGNIFFDTKREALGSDEVYGSSFSVGQEPDSFRGKYDAGQAYRGNISEINFWDFVLSEALPYMIGKYLRGGGVGDIYQKNKPPNVGTVRSGYWVL